ncbi:MAG: TatD family hydrolase [Nitrospirae bacterium]|nr:TatD family hydrolase [Nitrospirota bacterium]MBI3604963.1 TatD family hydrolase [Nitrospirota bacterium]
MLTDTHCHLDMLGNPKEVEEIIARARETGLVLMVTIGTDLPSSQKAGDYALNYPDVYATAGMHPHEVKTVTPEIFDPFRELIRKNSKIRGIGETGLDFYYDHSPREAQRSFFAGHIQLAKETGLPLIVHSRNAAEETIEILKKENAAEAGGIIHCFTENLEMARKAIEMNFMISFSGIITFKNSTDLQEAAAQIPLDKILIETDAPFLSPAPYRGKKNEPMYVKKVAEKIAEIKKIPLEEVEWVTTQNAKKIYGIPVY